MKVTVWCMMMAVIVATASAQHPTWNLDCDEPEQLEENYSKFLESVRNALGHGAPRVCNIPVTTNTEIPAYVLVNLVTGHPDFQQRTITLALRASDGYVVGFQDTSLRTDALRANFFSDFYNGEDTTNIFGNGAIPALELPCSSTYPDLVRKAKVSREKLNIGISNLKGFIQDIYGQEYNNNVVIQSLAKFALLSIQMVVEAARFKYIEDQVKYRGQGTFEAGDRMTLIENNWSKFSDKYHETCEPNDDDFTYEEMELGLLKYPSALNSNDGHAALGFI